MMTIVKLCDAQSYAGDHSYPRRSRREAKANAAVDDHSPVELVRSDAKAVHGGRLKVIPARAADLALNPNSLI